MSRQLSLFDILDRPAPVVEPQQPEIVRGEYAENSERKDFLPSEIEAIRRAMAPAVATPVGRRSKKVETFHHSDDGKTRDKIGSFAGVSGRTVEKIAAVVEAAEREPRKFRTLVEIIVSPSWIRSAARRAAAEILSRPVAKQNWHRRDQVYVFGNTLKAAGLPPAAVARAAVEFADRMECEIRRLIIWSVMRDGRDGAA